MRQNTIAEDAFAFGKYFFGYALLLLPVMAALFDGRALAAQVAWYYEHIGVPDQIYIFSPIGALPRAQQKVNIQDYQIPQSVFQADVEAYLVIPKIKIGAPVVFPQTVDNKELLSYLERGVIKYRASADIGQPGTTIILGHSSAYPWYKGQYGSVFALLSKLEPGDQFVVATKDKKYVYQVSGKKIVMPQEFKIEQTDNQSHLILMSCWPVRSNALRIMVASDLVATL